MTKKDVHMQNDGNLDGVVQMGISMREEEREKRGKERKQGGSNGDLQRASGRWACEIIERILI
jgi:hypothetical protein